MQENPDRVPGPEGITGPPEHRKSCISSILTVLVALGVVGLLVALLLPSVRRVREPARRNHCANKLKQIGLALHNYANAHGAFPPAYTTDADGKPLHSWRTLILPFMEEKKLYDSIDLTKPWDDPVNAEACQTRLDEYICPSFESNDRTTYLAVVTPNSCLRATEPRRLSEIKDPAAQTLLLIEVDVDHAVPWMSPVDADEEVVLGIGPQSPLPHHNVLNAVFVDGSVRLLSDHMPAAQRRALISITGNDQALAKAALESKD